MFLFAEKTLQNPLQVLDQRGLPGFDQGWHGDDAAHEQEPRDNGQEHGGPVRGILAGKDVHQGF